MMLRLGVCGDGPLSLLCQVLMAGQWRGSEAVVVQVNLNGWFRVALPHLRGVYIMTGQPAGWQ
jgi:hypothetical protein